MTLESRPRGILRSLAIAATLTLVALAVAVASADGYVAAGRAWPRSTITYYVEASAYRAPVNRAARVWNRADVGVRLARASREDADVLVAYGGPRCGGYALLGYQRRYRSSVHLGRGCSRDFITLTAVHEFGHVLGLDHETRRCARMNPGIVSSGSPNRCAVRSLSHWLARPLTSDDLRGARVLYR